MSPFPQLFSCLCCVPLSNCSPALLIFPPQVQQQEEEAKQRKMQEEMWTMHVDRCRLLGHDPYLTPIFDPTYQYFWDPVAANWQPYTGSGEVGGQGWPCSASRSPYAFD